MAVSPQSRPPGQDTKQVPSAEPYRGQSDASGGEAMETALHALRDESDFDSVAEVRGITPPQGARTDPHRGTGEMGTEGLDPSQPLD